MPRGILPVVTDLEPPWQNCVVERHGALFKMAFEKACILEVPTTETEVHELIDFTFAELNRRVGRAGFSPCQSFWTTTPTSVKFARRQLRLPSSLLKDDFVDPFMIAQDAKHEMRRSEAIDDGSHSGFWWLEHPSSYTDGRMELRDGVDLARASWVHMLNCLHKCDLRRRGPRPTKR